MSPDSIHPSPEELFAYRDGELPSDRRVLIEAHVVGCHVCRERIDRVSQLEAGLRQSPDQVEGDYYAQLSRSVLERIEAGAQRPEEPIRRERRRADLQEEARPSRAPKFPWPALVSTVAAAAAVVVVVVMLFQQGVVRRTETGRVVLSAPREPAAPTPAAPTPAAPTPAGEPPTSSAPSPIGPAPSAEAPATPPPPARSTAEVPTEPVAGKVPGALRAKGTGAETPLALAPVAEKKAVARATDRAAAAPPGEGPPTAREAPQVATSNAAVPPHEGESPYRALLLRHGLPPLWQEGRVSPQALRAAEPGLRTLYQMGRAGADSASVRLYLAEAARLTYEANPDSSLHDRIVHHYLRAIRLAGPGSDIGRIARERLQSFSR